MKIIHFFIISLFLVTLFSLSANAVYESIGYDDYRMDAGEWNANLNTADQKANIIIYNRLNPPLVSDLDNDGINEIIVQDGKTIYIYNYLNMTFKASKNLFGYSDIYSNMEILDINNDTYKEIVILEQSDANSLSLWVLNYTNSKIETSDYVADIFGTYEGGEAVIGCDPDTFRCMAFLSRYYNYFGSTDDHIYGVGYNGITESLTANKGTAGIVGLTCFSSIKDVQVEDTNADGVKDFTISYYLGSTVAVEKVYMETWKYADPPTINYVVTNTDVFQADNIDGASTCNSSMSSTFTIPAHNSFGTPLVMDLNNNPDNIKERILPVVVNTGGAYPEFEVYAYDGDSSTELRQYPSWFQAIGMIVSNPFRADIFATTPDNDFCVLGFDEASDTLDLLCASEKLSDGILGTVKSYEFIFDASDYNALDVEFDSFDILTHSSDQYEALTYDNYDNSEIITSYGVFSVTDDGLDLIYENPTGQSSTVIMADVEDQGSSDMLVMTRSNLFVYDDDIENYPAFIQEIEINPCIEQTIKVNETMTVNVKVNDSEGDKVRAKVTAYYQDDNEQEMPYSSYVSPNTPLSFQFGINKTGNAFKLKIEGNSINDNLTIDTLIYTFNVNTFGVERGDCVTTKLFVDPNIVSIDSGLSTTGVGRGTNLNNNSITNVLTYFSEASGLGVGIFFILIIALVVWSIAQAEAESSKKHGRPFSMTGVIVYSLIACFLLLIIGTALGLISYSIIMIIIVVLIFALSMMFRHSFTGSRQ